MVDFSEYLARSERFYHDENRKNKEYRLKFRSHFLPEKNIVEKASSWIYPTRHICFADIPMHIRFDSDDDENDDTQGS
uniref:Uncharacterized protein n=1 Tax=Romanomermis culicivorax TaxID=13658 RepID=A0A915HUJ7_ROMCU